MTIEDNQKEHLFKVLLVGDSNTGKTNLLRRLTSNTFNPIPENTNGFICNTYQFQLNDKTITADIWDIAGEEKYRTMTKPFYHEAHGVLLIYDISNYTTFENVAGWLKDIRDNVDPKTVVKLAGNKSDLEPMRSVSTEEAKIFAGANGLSFIETSAFTGNCIETVFHGLINEIYNEMKPVATNIITQSAPNDTYHKKDLSFDDSQQRPFHVVLVDIQEAAKKRRIVCVEKPLDGADLRFVALSYRWGELPETLVDTQLGYVARITSFDLWHFYHLCSFISYEPDLKSMKYVWVDAICVDQQNKARRKATIYQMTNIYERANYIVAVPDLHLAHLANTRTYLDIIGISLTHSKYVYHLIQGNTEQLIQVDEEWLAHIRAPKDRRQLLASSRDQFSEIFIKYQQCGMTHDPEQAFEYMQKTIESFQGKKENQSNTSGDYYDWLIKEMIHDGWRKRIAQRTGNIKLVMKFLEDLIKDWASRVWVISEFNIAKKKNKMKYWFVQIEAFGLDLPFFEFDFGGNTFEQHGNGISDNKASSSSFISLCDGADQLYQDFLKTMVRNLSQQTFLEMILKSKASKCEDRLYAILPFSDYRDKISLVDSCHIDTLLSVKLKLFEWLEPKDKLQLLFLSDQPSVEAAIMPTFATGPMAWRKDAEDPPLDTTNVDEAAIMFIPPDDDSLYQLTLKPKEYFCRRPTMPFLRNFQSNKPVLWLLGFEDCHTVYQVCIPRNCGSSFKRNPHLGNGHYIDLMGSFENNKWIIARVPSMDTDKEYEHVHTTDDFPEFHIY